MFLLAVCWFWSCYFFLYIHVVNDLHVDRVSLVIFLYIVNELHIDRVGLVILSWNNTKCTSYRYKVKNKKKTNKSKVIKVIWKLYYDIHRIVCSYHDPYCILRWGSSWHSGLVFKSLWFGQPVHDAWCRSYIFHSTINWHHICMIYHGLQSF